MGDTKSKPQVETQQDADTPKIDHQKFANRRIAKGANDEEVIKIKVTVPSQKQFSNWKQQLHQINQEESLLLPISHEFTKEGFCGTAGTVEITYENYPFLLSDEIQNRSNLQVKYFQENQLWYLVYTLLSAANYFHRKGRKIGDVRPTNVFISEDGSVKTACIYSWPMERTNYQKNIDKQSTYLAPEELSDLGYGRIEPVSNFELAETFSLGLTVLDAATLTDSRTLYKNHHSFNYEGLAASLDLLNSKDYSPVFKMLISNMCETNAEKRTTSVALYQWLNPFDDAINNFEEFQPKKLPEKFNTESQAEPVASPIQIPMTHSNVYKYSSVPMNLVHQQPNPVFYQTPSISSKIPYPSVNVAKIPPGSYIRSPDQGFQTFNPVILQNYTSNPQTTLPPLPLQTVESTYVPYNSKFSLDRIDQQLQQSRKLFPV